MLSNFYASFSKYLLTGDQQILPEIFDKPQEYRRALVYRNGFISSCTNALRSNFPSIEAIVGADYFTKIAQEYVLNQPPEKSALALYGRQFTTFLRDNSKRHQLPYLHCFAQLDYAWLQAYFAIDSSPLSEDDIQHWLDTGKAIPELTVALNPSARLMSLNYSVLATWTQLKANAILKQKLAITHSTEESLIWRTPQDTIHTQRLNEAQIAFLQPLWQSASIQDACENAFKTDATFDVLSFFSSLLQNGLLLMKIDQR